MEDKITMDKNNNVERLKRHFEVSLGGKYVGTFPTMQRARTAAEVAESVAKILDLDATAKIREVAAPSETEAA